VLGRDLDRLALVWWPVLRPREHEEATGQEDGDGDKCDGDQVPPDEDHALRIGGDSPVL
jgi:hypothetical protein